MALHPPVLWAQRSNEDEPSKNLVFLTIELLDPVDVKIDLTSTKLNFKAKSDSKDYELDLEFFDEIDPENSGSNQSGNRISFVLRKKVPKSEFWPRLLKEKLKLHYIKTDFDKWVDEDEQDEQPETDEMADMMNMGGPGGAPGLGGLGGPGGPGNFDISQLLGNAGGNGNFDISSLAAQLGQSGADDIEELEDESEEQSSSA